MENQVCVSSHLLIDQCPKTLLHKRAFTNFQAVLLISVFEQRMSFQMFYFMENNRGIIVWMNNNKCWMGSESESVSSTAFSWRSASWVSGGKASENFWLFYNWRANEQVKIEEIKQAKLFSIQGRCQSLCKYFKIKFYEDWVWKLN